MINLGVGIATGIICAVTGMPNPAGLGALAATLNFFPIIGPVAMFVILAAVGIISFSTISAGLIAPLAFVGLTFLEGHFVTPTIIGRRLELNALAVFMALAFWTWLWGPMGGFLSSPLLIVALDPQGASLCRSIRRSCRQADRHWELPMQRDVCSCRSIFEYLGAFDVEYGRRVRNEKSDG